MNERGNRWELQAVVPSPKGRNLLWHAFSLDTAYLEGPDHHEPFEKPGAHLFWVLAGHGTLETDDSKYLLQPGNVVWLVDMTKVRTYARLRPGNGWSSEASASAVPPWKTGTRNLEAASRRSLT